MAPFKGGKYKSRGKKPMKAKALFKGSDEVQQLIHFDGVKEKIRLSPDLFLPSGSLFGLQLMSPRSVTPEVMQILLPPHRNVEQMSKNQFRIVSTHLIHCYNKYKAEYQQGGHHFQRQANPSSPYMGNPYTMGRPFSNPQYMGAQYADHPMGSPYSNPQLMGRPYEDHAAVGRPYSNYSREQNMGAPYAGPQNMARTYLDHSGVVEPYSSTDPQKFANPFFGHPTTSDPNVWPTKIYNPLMAGPIAESPGPSQFSDQMPGSSFGHPGVSNPSFGHPGVKNPSFGHPGVSNPSFGHPGVKNPSFGHPGVKNFNGGKKKAKAGSQWKLFAPGQPLYKVTLPEVDLFCDAIFDRAFPGGWPTKNLRDLTSILKASEEAFKKTIFGMVKTICCPNLFNPTGPLKDHPLAEPIVAPANEILAKLMPESVNTTVLIENNVKQLCNRLNKTRLLYIRKKKALAYQIPVNPELFSADGPLFGTKVPTLFKHLNKTKEILNCIAPKGITFEQLDWYDARDVMRWLRAMQRWVLRSNEFDGKEPEDGDESDSDEDGDE